MKDEYARIASDVLESWVTAPQAIHDAVARCEALAIKQLPAGMSDCTIIFKRCEKGHGRLIANNWIDPGCQKCALDAALANKPVRELTPEEIEKISDKLCMTGAAHSFARAVIAAHIAKQSEPDEIPFDQKKLDEGGWLIKLVPPGESSHTFSGQTKVTLVRKT